jgi:putative oxidoreductase
MNKWSPLLLSALRIVVGLLFVGHGTQKVLGYPASAPHEGAAHAMSPVMAHLAPLSGYIELIGGALLIIGLFTRIAAFICSGEMAVAYFMAHAPSGIYPILNHGELAVLYAMVRKRQ